MIPHLRMRIQEGAKRYNPRHSAVFQPYGLRYRNGLKTGTEKHAKSRSIRVTTVNPYTRAVAAIIASSAKKRDWPEINRTNNFV